MSLGRGDVGLRNGSRGPVEKTFRQRRPAGPPVPRSRHCFARSVRHSSHQPAIGATDVQAFAFGTVTQQLTTPNRTGDRVQRVSSTSMSFGIAKVRVRRARAGATDAIGHGETPRVRTTKGANRRTATFS